MDLVLMPLLTALLFELQFPKEVMIFKKKHNQIQPVKKFTAVVRNDFNKTFNCLVRNGKRFSIILDKYTSLKNQKHIYFIIYQRSKHWNLGLTRVPGSLPAEKAAVVVTEKVLQMEPPRWLSSENWF